MALRVSLVNSVAGSISGQRFLLEYSELKNAAISTKVQRFCFRFSCSTRYYH